MKKKKIAALLAFPLGIFGLHRFYLGQKFLGILYFILGIVSMILIDEGPFILGMVILALIDAILFAVMPTEEFNEKYNRKAIRMNDQSRPKAPSSEKTSGPEQQSFQVFRTKGINAYRNYDYQMAIRHFERALQFKTEDPAIHFNLACCHSMLEDEEAAFKYLDNAVKYGFDDFDKIHTHPALAYLRTLEDFDLFVANDYESPQLPLSSFPPNPKEQKEIDKSEALLEQLRELANLRDKGILTDDEYAEQKRRMIEENKRNRL